MQRLVCLVLLFAVVLGIPTRILPDKPIHVGRTIPVHIPTQAVDSNATFEVPSWLGVYYVAADVSANWTLPLTIGNGGQTYPGEFLFIRNYGPESIILYSTAPETIEGGASYLIPANSLIELISGYPDWIVVDQFSTEALPLPNNPKYYGAVGDCIADDTQAIQSAIDYVSSNGGGEVYIPSGCYSVTAPAATRVAPNEGNAFTLSEENSNLLIRGESKNTVQIVPASNKVSIFDQVGASNITIRSLSFNNSRNGILRYQVRPPSTGGPNTGVAGLGNNANSAYVQWSGPGTDIADCYFSDFNLAVYYNGLWTDISVSSGELRLQEVTYSGCAFCTLVAQPVTLYMRGIVSMYTIDSVNADGSIDPGHQLYLTNRPGAPPEQIIISQSRDEYGNSSSIKIRKGKNVVISDVSVYKSGRGIELWNVEKYAITNAVILLSEVDDDNQNALELTDTGYGRVTNVVIDIRGVSAWGIRVRPNAYVYNVGATLTDITVIYDNQPAGKAPYLISEQMYMRCENLRALHTSSTTGSNYPFDVRNTSYSVFSYPQHISNGYAPSDAYRLVSFDGTSSNNWVTFSDEDISVPYTTSTVLDAGINNKIVRQSYGNSDGRILSNSFGSVSQPAISFYGDDDNGLYRSGTNAWALGAGGIEIARVLVDRMIVSSGGENFLVLRGASASSSTGCTVATDGTSTNVPLSLLPKGTGSFAIGTATARAFLVGQVANQVNYIQVLPSATGGVASVAANGADTDIELRMTSKGADPVSVAPGGTVAFSCTSAACNSVVALQDSGIRVVRVCTAGAGITCSVTDGVLTVSANSNLQDVIDMQKSIDSLKAEISELRRLIRSR